MNFLFITATTICLISGLAAFHDVFGYPGGHVEIFCFFQTTVYFCKFDTNVSCQQLIEAQAQERSHRVQRDRLTLYDAGASVALMFRNLNTQDAGTYRCGESGTWRHDVNLKVNTDPCCSGRKMIQAHPGQTVNIDCSYPRKFASNSKTFHRLSDDYVTQLIYRIGEKNQDGRFLLTEDTSRNVVRVSVRDVSEDDAGIYSCVAWRKDESVGYYSHVTEIRLYVSAGNSDNMPDTPQTGVFVISIVCVCVTLLLIGGGVLIYKLKCCKTCGSAPPQTRGSLTADGDYQNARNSQSDVTPNANQPDSYYQELRWNTNQPESNYQILNQTHSLKPNTNILTPPTRD